MTDSQESGKDQPSTESSAESKPVQFHEIANGKNEVTIEHDGQTYRLRVTKNGKLLLNK